MEAAIKKVKREKKKVIFEIVFEMVHGQPYKGFQKNAHIPVPIIWHWNWNVSPFKLPLIP
jgi:hypothetical protein